MELKEFYYTLPENLISQRLHTPRDECRLMVLDKGIVHEKFLEIVNYLQKGDVLVLNNTKVSHSRIVGRKETGSQAEIVLLKKLKKNVYEAKVRTKNPHPGTIIVLKNGNATITGQKDVDTFIVRLSSEAVLKKSLLPIPPYINRTLTDADYQTVFSKNSGSLASPTAGLHFTKELLKKIHDKGVKIVYVTLHISYGTFKKIETIDKYVMDPEYFEISKRTADIINARRGKLFVVGTTTLKALETSSDGRKILSGKGHSRLFIYPPFKFNAGVDVLITNFHLPESTLLLLTCAFGGKKRVMDAYRVAVRKKYGFFSLGDAMMIYKS